MVDAATHIRAELARYSFEDLSRLYPYEKKWQMRQPWLLELGYSLRPRFRVGWVPTWQKFEWLPKWVKYGLLSPYTREDSLALEYGSLIMDATRLSDGAYVIMKAVDNSRYPNEVAITTYLSSAGLARDPRNHCVPVLDSFDAPDDPTRTIIVLPLLRRFDDPPFETVGEAVDCIRQLLEGLQFMHEQYIAHRDCTWLNIMMDASPLYPAPFHPAQPDRRRDWKGPAKHYSRADRPVKYYFIDYGLSKRYEAGLMGSHRDLPVTAGDKTVPEHQGPLINVPTDPFATDVYLLGNVINDKLIKVHTPVNDPRS
ncbi:unnamed protein product [Peniophora sp. CBMAI 1063]|nr:unnamed protein product [Peniophora sp. CBMAI 1063]